MISHAMQGTTSTVDRNPGPNASLMSQLSSGEDGVNNEEEHLISRTNGFQWGCDGAGQQQWGRPNNVEGVEWIEDGG